MIASKVSIKRPLLENLAADSETARHVSKQWRVSGVILTFRRPLGSPEVSKSKAMYCIQAILLVLSYTLLYSLCYLGKECSVFLFIGLKGGNIQNLMNLRKSS